MSASVEKWWRPGSAITLMFLAPVVAEVLSGTTRLSFIFVLIPEMLVWGGGTLLIREIVIRRRLDWRATLVLALALSVAEEFVIQQTALAPIPWIDQAHQYGRFAGVNWVWLLAMMGFTATWVVFIPIRVTESIYRERSGGRWLTKRGIIVCSVFFVVGARIAWYGWTQRARPLTFHTEIYKPPLVSILAGAGTIIGFAAVALCMRRRPGEYGKASGEAPGPWFAGSFAAVSSFVWLLLFPVAYGLWMKLPVWIPLAAGVGWASATLFVIRRWANARGWSEPHGLAVCFGSMFALMAGGFWGSRYWPRIDLVGKIILNAIAVWLLIRLVQEAKSRDGLNPSA